MYIWLFPFYKSILTSTFYATFGLRILEAIRIMEDIHSCGIMSGKGVILAMVKNSSDL
jgi:hypothetical protein